MLSPTWTVSSAMSGTYSETSLNIQHHGGHSVCTYRMMNALLLVVSLLSSTYIGSFMLELTMIKSGLEPAQTHLQGIVQGSITHQCGALHP